MLSRQTPPRLLARIDFTENYQVAIDYKINHYLTFIWFV